MQNRKIAIVQVEEGSIVKGKKIWTEFYDTTKAGNQASIKMVKKLNGKIHNCTLTYDGNYYSYRDEKENYKYKCLLDLTGKLPRAEYMTHSCRVNCAIRVEKTEVSLW